MTTVVDTSVILAVLNDEDGTEKAFDHLRGSRLSAVNYSEVLAKAGDQGAAADAVRSLIESLEVEVVAFDRVYADRAAALRPSTRYKNISFADRACLAQALVDRLPLLTADRDWSLLDLELELIQIR